MGAAQKKVIVRRFKGGLAWGYLPASGFLDEGHVRILEADGRTKAIELRDIKTICFVRDFNLDDTEDPERIGRRNFAGRPRGEGLWLRLGFRDGESLEGLSVFDMVFREFAGGGTRAFSESAGCPRKHVEGLRSAVGG